MNNDPIEAPLKRFESLGDWYYLERQDSKNSDPEGTKEDWIYCIELIKKQLTLVNYSKHKSFTVVAKRLGFQITSNGINFFSYRNQRDDKDVVFISVKQIQDWLKQAEELLKSFNYAC